MRRYLPRSISVRSGAKATLLVDDGLYYHMANFIVRVEFVKETPLKPTYGDPRSSRIVVWDIETDPTTFDPFLVGVRWGESPVDWVQFTGPGCMSDLLEWLLTDADMGEDTLYFAHNGGGFDHLFLIYEMVERQPRRFKVRPVLSGGSAILVMVDDKHTNRSFMLVDSLRLLNMSLKKIGEAMGGARKQDFDIHTPKDDPRWLEYNNVDTLVLYQAITKVQSALNTLGGQMKVTAASSAMDLFRRKYLEHDIWPNTTMQEHYRQYYYGGRVEIFDMRRRNDVKLYDVNSLYPHACTFPLPVKLESKDDTAGLLYRHDDVEWLDGQHASGVSWFLEALVEVPDTVFAGPLPHRTKEGKLIFPVGRFWGKWNSYDIRNLLLCGGRIVKVVKAHRWRNEPIARQMMMDLYAQRVNKDRPEMGLAAKLLMNSWYGKTGQKTEREMLMFGPEEEDTQSGEWECLDFERDFWKHIEVKNEPHIMPQIAAQVTAIARSIHYPYLLRSNDPIYCDTDCIVQSDNMATSLALGVMKLEEGFDWFQAYLPKLYHGKSSKTGEIKNRAKGFGGWNKEVYEQGIVGHLASGGVVKVKGPAKLKTLLTGESMKPRERKLDKQIRSCYDKRVVLSDGRTKPIKLSEG